VVFVLLVVVSTSAFGLDYISYLNPNANIVIDGHGFYTTWFVFDMWGIGATGEMQLFKNFYVGADATFYGIGVPSINLNVQGVSLAGYAKYIIFDAEQSQELIGLPFILGVVAGFDSNVCFADLDAYGSSDFFEYAESQFELGGAVIVGFQFTLFNKPAIISAHADLSMRFYEEIVSYVGYEAVKEATVKPAFSYGFDAYFILDEKSSFALFYVPLLGIGASYTIVL